MALGVRASVAFLLAVVLICPSFAAEDRPPQPELRDEAWRILHEGLNEKRASKRTEAVQALSLLAGDRRAATFALRALHDSDAKVRSAAATTLGQLHARNAIPALKQALGDKEISVVLAASYSLFLLKDPSAYGIYYAILMGDKKANEGLIQAQLNRLKDPKQMAELGFQEGMGFVPFGGMGVDAYRAMSKKDNAPVRAAAARILSMDPDSVTEDALIQSALADKNVIVRQAALDALAERGDAKCIERLLKNFSDSNDAVRYRTAATILRLSAPANKPARPSKK